MLFFRYIQSNCTFIKASVLDRPTTLKYNYDMWVSLSSACKFIKDPAPCYPTNGMFVIKARAHDPYGTNDYNSCWTGGLTASPQYKMSLQGNVDFSAGNAVCCAQGGNPGQTNSKRVEFKVTLDAEINEPYASVSGLNGLSQPCHDDSEPINVTIFLPSSGQRPTMKYNYSMPLLRCQVLERTNRSQRAVTIRDVVSCSLDMESGETELSCLVNRSSGILSVSVCGSEMNLTYDMRLNVSKEFNISSLARPSCNINFTGRYRQPFSDQWITVKSESNVGCIYNVIDVGTPSVPNSKTTSFRSGYLAAIVGVPAVIVLLTIVLFASLYVYRIQKRRKGFSPSSLEEDVSDHEMRNMPREVTRVQTVACLFSKKDKWVKDTLLPKLRCETGIKLVMCSQPGRLLAWYAARQLKKSNKVLVVLSTQFVKEKSKFNRFTINNALSQGFNETELEKAVIPIRIDDCDIPVELVGIENLDYFGAECDFDEFWRRLQSALWEEGEQSVTL